MSVRRWLSLAPLRIRSIFLRDRVEEELDEELRFHFDQHVEAALARGLTPVEAQAAARKALGPIQLSKEECRDMRGVGWIEDAIKDLVFAIRQLRKAPAFTAVAVLSLALGIGANTAIFTLIESTLLRPIAVRHPERLRLLTWKEQPGGWVPANFGYRSPVFDSFYEQRPTPDGGLMHTDFRPPLYRAFLRDNRFFESLFAFKELGRVTMVADNVAEPVNCFLVSGNFYRGMEVTPVIGRAIGPGDDIASPDGAAVLISYQYWTRRFNRSPSILGKTITLNDLPATIIGVNPEYFTGIEPGANFEIWAPLHLSPIVYGRIRQGADSRNSSVVSFLDADRFWSIPMMGRLKQGVSDKQVETAFDAMFQLDVNLNPGSIGGFLNDPAKRPRFLLQSASRGVDYLTQRYDQLLLTVLSLSALVLLIACANVADLLLTKSAVRQREIAMRLALGAGRWRIARQLLAEGLLLAAMAGVVGVILGYWARNGIPALLATPWRPSPFDTSFDLTVLMVSLGITFFTGVLFSLAPMWESRRVEVNDALKDGSRGTAGLSKLRLGRLLVVVQVGLSVFLLAGAGLCVKTFTNLRDMPLGFQPKGVVQFSLDPPRLSYPPERERVLPARLQERLRAIPGIQSATFSGSSDYVLIAGGTVVSLGIGSGFFETMGIPILQGRALDEHDQASGLRAVVVNQQFVQAVFHGKNALGGTFNAGPDHTTYEIVGVCADWRVDRFRSGITPAFYRALRQEPYAGSIDFRIKVAPGAELIEQVRDAVRSVDPKLVVADVHTEVEQIGNAMAPQRFMASLAEVFGALALLLASIGIYGVMAYAVARRTNEIGIRTALGARPGGVAWLVLRETLLLAAAGIALGLPALLGVSPVLDHFLGTEWRSGFLDGLKPNDPAVITLAALVLGSAALLAGYIPARRAASIDPMSALRHD
jgi:predicted permease